MALASKLKDLKETLLMGPGPSCVPPEVYNAMATFTIGHMDPRFIDIMNDLKKSLQQLLNTNNRLTLPVSGTGSSGMETAFVNLIEKDDPVLILVNGVFGVRMKELCLKLGASVDTLEFTWGTPVVPSAVEEKLASKKYKLIAVVHAETSTGVRNPIKEIGVHVNKTDALYLVDTVTSLGGIEVRMDDWGVDALYSGTQKCLSCPPGLAPLSFAERALEILLHRSTPVPSWYFDLGMIIKYWEGNTRVYHHTAPVNMVYGLYQALELIRKEGADLVFARHMEAHRMLVSELDKIGLKMLVEENYRLPMLNAVLIPEGVVDSEVRGRLLNEYLIEIGGGLGPLAGKIWRIGVMGHTARKENVQRVVAALKSVLKR